MPTNPDLGAKEKRRQIHINHHAMKALNDDLQMRSDWTLPLATGPEHVKSNESKGASDAEA